MQLFNTHSHVDSADHFTDDREQVLVRAQEMGVTRLMVIGCSLDSIPTALALSERYDWVYATIGIHPTDSLQWSPETEALIRQGLENPKVRAIGEIGLDYYWKDSAPVDHMQEIFRTQIRLARELKKPIVIHDRDAHEDVVRILEEEHAEDVGGILHCFSADWAIAERALALGFHLGIGGTVTYKSNTTVQDVVRRMPLERLVLETDDPYLAPVPFRGKRNEPGYVKYVAEFVAGLREMTVDELAAITTANGLRVFGLK